MPTPEEQTKIPTLYVIWGKKTDDDDGCEHRHIYGVFTAEGVKNFQKGEFSKEGYEDMYEPFEINEITGINEVQIGKELKNFDEEESMEGGNFDKYMHKYEKYKIKYINLRTQF